MSTKPERTKFTWDFSNVRKPKAKHMKKASPPVPSPGSALPKAGKLPGLAKTSPEGKARGGARFVEKSTNPVLARVEFVPAGRPGEPPRPVARPPFICSTSVSIQSTCSDICPLKGNGCYVTSGRMAFGAQTLDRETMGLTASEVIAEEVRLIDGAFGGGPIPQDGAKGGRDMRCHVGGDTPSAEDAATLGGACQRWVERGGNPPFTYSHRWREIPKAAFGPWISVLASVELPEDIERAREAGYAAAILVERFPSERAFHLQGTTMKIIPCPGQTRNIPCVECRLCIDRDLLAMNVAIGFEARGAGARKVRETLVQLRVPSRTKP